MKVTLRVPAMSCNHCKMTIDTAVKKADNIQDIKIDLDSKIVEIEGNPNIDQVVGNIQDAGYTVEEILNSQ
jgi:copper chaperone CopZ